MRMMSHVLPLKRSLIRLAGFSFHRLGAFSIHDATNNFRLFRRHVLKLPSEEASSY